MVNVKDALYIERRLRKNGGPRLFYVYNCSTSDCTELVRVRTSKINTHSGKCLKHSHQVFPPFHSTFTGLKRCAKLRGISVELTFDEFLSLVNLPCHYCGNLIPWSPFKAHKANTSSYFIDRKDSNGSYTLSNCVSCCTSCNLRKRSTPYHIFKKIEI